MTFDAEPARVRIEDAFERRYALSATELASLRPILSQSIDALDAGLIRAAIQEGDEWRANVWVKKLILLSLMTGDAQASGGCEYAPRACDKLPLKFDSWSTGDFRAAALRVVPGAVVRRGAHIGRDVVLMPSFVNIGASVGDRTMVDTWATIGSCAQVGQDCHISGGVGIGGVLEPLGDMPVIIEDAVFVGARSEIAEGVRVRRGAVIAMGVFLGRSTPIVERSTGRVLYGEVPENAVVVPGARGSTKYPGTSTYAAIIVKYADESTRRKTALNSDVRRDVDA